MSGIVSTSQNGMSQKKQAVLTSLGKNPATALDRRYRDPKFMFFHRHFTSPATKTAYYELDMRFKGMAAMGAAMKMMEEAAELLKKGQAAESMKAVVLLKGAVEYLTDAEKNVSKAKDPELARAYLQLSGDADVQLQMADAQMRRETGGETAAAKPANKAQQTARPTSFRDLLESKK